MATRSVLIAPADDAEKCRKAATAGADAVMWDLEDGVHPDRRTAARATVADLLADVDAESDVWVRVNADEDVQQADVDAALEGPAPDAVVLPKAGSAADVDRLADRLAAVDCEVPVVALVESAAGVLAARAIAAAGPTSTLVYGAEDLAGDLGTASGDPAEGVLAHAREHVLLAARAEGVVAVDTHYPAYEDLDGLGDAARRAAAMGYDGKLAIHPEQVGVIHDAFAPDEAALAWARRVLDARDRADEAAVLVVDGEMIDAPQIRRAERILARAPDRE